MPSTVQPSAALDVGRFIDERPYGRYQLLVAVMCGVIVFMDGFDAQSMGFVAPRSRTIWASNAARWGRCSRAVCSE
jgi:AAHS family 4-hydroxybenzoate transporter-like MFS transporter